MLFKRDFVNHAGASNQGKKVLALFFLMRGETSTPHDRWRRCARTGRLLRATSWRFVSPPVAFNPTVLLRRASGRASAAPENDEVKKRRRMALLKLALSTPYPSSYPVESAAPTQYPECNSPPICAQLFALCSKVISIDKLPEAERALLPDCLNKDIRPVARQCLFGKMIDRQVFDTDE